MCISPLIKFKTRDREVPGSNPARCIYSAVWHLFHVVLLAKCNTPILYSYFHLTFAFLLLVNVTGYRCIGKKHSKSFLPHFSTFFGNLVEVM